MRRLLLGLMCMGMSMGSAGVAVAAPAKEAVEVEALEVEALEVEGGQVRAMPPGLSLSAAFVVLHNTGSHPVTLVGARTPVAERAELHRTRQQGDQVRMEPVERVAIPAGERLALEPGGLHLMLLGVQRRLEEGDTVKLELLFADGGRLELSLPVVDIRRQDADHHGHH